MCKKDPNIIFFSFFGHVGNEVSNKSLEFYNFFLHAVRQLKKEKNQTSIVQDQSLYNLRHCFKFQSCSTDVISEFHQNNLTAGCAISFDNKSKDNYSRKCSAGVNT